MAEATRVSIGLLGYGEAGKILAEEFARHSRAAVRAYDILFLAPAFFANSAQAAASVGVAAVSGLDAFCSECDVIISVVTADQAVAAAEAAAKYLKGGQLFLDFNSVAPATKRAAAAFIEASGAAYVDCAVMATVPGAGLAVPILAGGKAARRAADLLNPFGMRIEVVSDEIGRASATKLCRSIVIKGMEALMVDFSKAAQQSGVFEDVVQSLDATFPTLNFAALAATMRGRVEQHGKRRAAEMREAAKMLDSLDLGGDLARAIADVHDHVARDFSRKGGRSADGAE
jgi:3-hydroxyisobutyrate dehydrogenase-like beta-hydroxyacid dehydrogenase